MGAQPAIGYPLLWLDFETSRLELDRLVVLEGAVALTTPFPDTLDLWAYEWLTAPVPSLDVLDLDPYVREMHTKSGLLDELLAAWHAGDRWTNLQTMERDILRVLDNHEFELVQVAGSGVGPFDMQLIRTRMPRLHERCYYGPLDVGQLRRWAEVAGYPVEREEGVKRHRAMADIERAREQADELLDWLRRLPMPVRPPVGSS